MAKPMPTAIDAVKSASFFAPITVANTRTGIALRISSEIGVTMIVIS